MLAMLLAALVSCAGGNGGETTAATDTAAAEVDPELAESIAKIDQYVDELAAQYNFDGAEFVYVGEGSQAPTEMNETGNVESDALYYRVREIEEKFHVKWSHYKPQYVEGTGDTNPVYYSVNQEVLAGGDAYDLIYASPISIGQPLLVSNTLIDVSNFTVVDLNREWWTASLRDTYTIGGAIYFLNGSIVSTDFMDTYSILFNKNVVEDYGIEAEELYSLVREGKWTFDKMIEIADTVATNESNSGVYRYGNANGLAILYGNGGSLTQFDDNDVPYVHDQLPKEISDLADKFSTLMGDDTISVNLKGFFRSEFENMEKKYGYKNYYEMFEDEKILFMFATTGDASSLRSREVEFGILPIPKKDTAQENYISYSDPWSYVNVSVPKCTKDVETTDVILEVMAALGDKYIKPTYYDKILKNRSTHDRDSKEMIDIIFSTKVYDMMDVLGEGNSNSKTCDMINAVNVAFQDTSSSFASRFFIQALKTNANIKMILENVERDNGKK